MFAPLIKWTGTALLALGLPMLLAAAVLWLSNPSLTIRSSAVGVWMYSERKVMVEWPHVVVLRPTPATIPDKPLALRRDASDDIAISDGVKITIVQSGVDPQVGRQIRDLLSTSRWERWGISVSDGPP